MSFCFWTPGKSGGRAVGITGGGGGRRRPARFKEPGPSIVPGSNCFALVIVGRWRGERRGAGLKLSRAAASTSLIHPSTLETRCFCQSALGIRPTPDAGNRID